MSSDLLSKGYEPDAVEKKWYDYWEKEKLFAAEENSDKKPYSIVIPPPNVTGMLHMGHALTFTMQDILCRYRRLRGDNVLWMPGTDHAGIATQNVVEKKLAAEGITREDLGREKFIENVWEWKEEYGSAIINQLKRLGSSCDWDRERFTMDEGLSSAVRKVFVDLYNQGLIYRGHYIINWCPRCNTALSDLEVEHADKDGKLYHIKYPFADGSGEFVVATTRPETMFGDTAVAINPEDERYKDLHNVEVKLPLTDRVIPVICDGYVDMEFGTGALKITPAHDPNDFDLGKKHKLESIKVIDDQGKMTDASGKFEGLDRFECRKAAVKELEELGFLVKIDEHEHSVGHCYRCQTVVEPNLSQQWFVKIKPLADKAIEAVETGKTRILPEQWTKTYYEWMYNIRDWCISRQIWWGHRIPAWVCSDCGKEIVALEDPSACPDCSSKNLDQETDVLDTWFSSALWPFSTMGWPEETKLQETFYPTSVLVTGFDILFFWVARMMMMGIHFKGEVPFHEVYIHALVRDDKGRKMSKSLGNVINPLEVIDQYGTDALRFTLTAFAAMGRDIKLSLDRVEGYRHFINKLWNAARFSFMHVEKGCEPINYDEISLVDKWILSKMRGVSKKVEKSLDEYKFNEVANDLYKFVWHELCDWYLEAAKPALFGKAGDAQMAASKNVLARVLRDTLIMLHPVVPFVTEEIWSKVPGTEGSIMVATYPEDADDIETIIIDEKIEKDMETLSSIVSGIRNIRAEMNIALSKTLNVIVQSEDSDIREMLESQKNFIMNLARLESLTIQDKGDRPKSVATVLVEGISVFVDLEGVIDFAKELERLEKELGKVEKNLDILTKKLSNKGFTDKAPAQVVAKSIEEKEALEDKKTKIIENIEKTKPLV
jgi:valyl-tRNA synthetase